MSSDSRDVRSGEDRRRLPARRTETALLLVPAACLALYAIAGSHAPPALAALATRDHTPPGTGAPEALRVCADPNNLPFSDSTGAGFENRIAAMVARDLGVPLEYTWFPQRRGFARNTLRAGRCDVVMGLPSSYELAMVTRPYYRSTYVFVTRADRRVRIGSFDDPALRRLRIGVHMMGDDYSNSPAATALVRRGLGNQIVGYMIYGDYTKPHPPSALIDAVARRDVDVAVAWGPLAGFFAGQSSTPLAVTPVTPSIDLPFTPFVFDIAMGVRRGDTTRRDLLDAELVRRRGEIACILARYRVPTLPPARCDSAATAGRGGGDVVSGGRQP